MIQWGTTLKPEQHQEYCTPNLNNPTIPQCPYIDICVGFTITRAQVSPSSSHIDVPSQVIAIAELHMQKKE